MKGTQCGHVPRLMGDGICFVMWLCCQYQYVLSSNRRVLIGESYLLFAGHLIIGIVPACPLQLQNNRNGALKVHENEN